MHVGLAIEQLAGEIESPIRSTRGSPGTSSIGASAGSGRFFAGATLGASAATATPASTHIAITPAIAFMIAAPSGNAGRRPIAAVRPT
jgi:hypothetical protein